MVLKMNLFQLCKKLPDNVIKKFKRPCVLSIAEKLGYINCESGLINWKKEVRDLFSKDSRVYSGKRLLIILDTMRYDAFELIVNNQLDNGFKRMYSDYNKAVTPGGATLATIKQTFKDGHGKDVYYYSSMPVVASDIQTGLDIEFLRAFEMNGYEMFKKVYDLWMSGWDERLKIVPPQFTTSQVERGIERGEDMIVAHYAPPHKPWTLGQYKISNYTTTSKSLAHEIDMWNAYLENLRIGLMEVGNLIEYCQDHWDDYEIVVTADHGELMGEWNMWGYHSVFLWNRVLREVPWIWLSE